MDEAEVHLTETRGTWPRGRDLGRLGRDDRGVETLEDLAEKPRPWKAWPRRPRGRDLRRLGRDDREAETLEDLAEMTETTGIWPMADPCHDDLLDGRPLLQLTFKPRLVKLIYH